MANQNPGRDHHGAVKVIPILVDAVVSQLPTFLWGKKGLPLHTDNAIDYSKSLIEICDDIIAVADKVADFVPMT